MARHLIFFVNRSVLLYNLMVWLHVGVMLNLIRILFLEAIYVRCMYGIGRSVCRISQGGGGPNVKISGILDIHCRVASSEAASLLLGGFGGMPPQENF